MAVWYLSSWILLSSWWSLLWHTMWPTVFCVSMPCLHNVYRTDQNQAGVFIFNMKSSHQTNAQATLYSRPIIESYMSVWTKDIKVTAQYRLWICLHLCVHVTCRSHMNQKIWRISFTQVATEVSQWETSGYIRNEVWHTHQRTSTCMYIYKKGSVRLWIRYYCTPIQMWGPMQPKVYSTNKDTEA